VLDGFLNPWKRGGMHSSTLPAQTTTYIISDTVDIFPNMKIFQSTFRIKLTFGGYWVSLLAGYWERWMACNYWSKGMAALGLKQPAAMQQ
jgi:hypothetical protein